MHCTFVSMGAENISLEVLSAMLKKNDHATSLAHDQSLFDDKRYLSIPWLAKWFEHRDVVIGQVVRSNPQLVAISVMTPTYMWALDMAREIKKYIDVPILFGGIHPTTCPEKVLAEDCVDIVCKGEGDFAIVELCNGIEEGILDTTIANLWFKVDGRIISNEQRSPVADIDTLPAADKELFAPHIPLKYCELSVPARGCPYACSFCSLSYYAKEAKTLGSKRLRERSVPVVIAELKADLEKYDYKWIEFRNNTFTANASWVKEFCEVYKDEIGRPFLAFAHPNTMNLKVATWLKEAGCFSIQLGVESYDEWVREHILNRKETNEAVHRSVDAMDEVGLGYTLDYILGLPKQEEKELLDAAQFFIDRKACQRISPNMLAYLPELDIVDIGLKYGEITQSDVKRMEDGAHDHYAAKGSVGEDNKKLRYFSAYRVFYRMIPVIPKRLAQFILDRRLFLALPYLQMDFILTLADFAQALRPSDLSGQTYIKSYIWLFLSRFKKNHPAYWRNSIKNHSAYRDPIRREPLQVKMAKKSGESEEPRVA